jgi:hypothetical protein
VGAAAVRVAATGREGGMVFKTLWNYVRVYRQQARALERLRAERAALERTQREVEAMTKKNEENERALASFAKWGADSVREGELSLREIDRVTTEMAETLGKMSEEHARDTFRARAREARETGRAQAEAFVKKNVMDETKE